MAKAIAKMVRITPRKVRLVCDLVRGKSILEAMQILEFTNKASAPVIQKLVKSAAANAINNDGKDINNLYVKEIYADEAPTMKRFQPRSQGRAFKIFKRSSHITAVVDEK